jgi:hypothetical protein
VMAISSMTEVSSDLKAEAFPKVNFGASKCAEPAAEGGMLNASRVLAGLRNNRSPGKSILTSDFVGSDDEIKIACKGLCWFYAREASRMKL